MTNYFRLGRGFPVVMTDRFGRWRAFVTELALTGRQRRFEVEVSSEIGRLRRVIAPRSQGDLANLIHGLRAEQLTEGN